ncbi:chemotaxis protein methyltransferase CheR [Marinomonas sp. MED121]|uniref:CheR family methyltransferase n=1 Tax=Marinomonas sp. MED121 TaxID=314277 RepID=UPI00006904F3|nr:CheR family methyltransferase [Marinomonas sp. MED121]EAQ64636.1 chemotaxis protein methyltransferase CheR [Marinomonas sp. MED121]
MLKLIKDDKHEFLYTNEDFKRVRLFLNKLTGINLAESKDAMVYSRLVRRVRALNLNSIGEYLEFVDANANEEQNFINALTTNLTSFFREEHHFDVLKDYVLSNSEVKRIWCAASSTGEEPYSIAISLVEALGKFDTHIEIIASDIDSNVLETAKQGIYHESRIQSLSLDRKKRFFKKGVGSNRGFVRVAPELREMVSFRKINLLDSQWPVEMPVNIIFCRNVMIYFNREMQEALLTRMVRLLKKDGLYIAGHSENFSAFSHVVKPFGKTTYKPA